MPPPLLQPLLGAPPLFAAPYVPLLPRAVLGGLGLGVMGLVAAFTLVALALARRQA